MATKRVRAQRNGGQPRGCLEKDTFPVCPNLQETAVFKGGATTLLGGHLNTAEAFLRLAFIPSRHPTGI